MVIRFNRLIFSLALVIFFYYLIFKVGFVKLVIGAGPVFDLLSPINLAVHETGHLLFYPLYAINKYRLSGIGTLLYIAGGSIVQWLVPLIFVGYFVFKKQFFSAFFILFWFGESLYDSVAYIADAKLMLLPLLNNNLIHDWNYILVDLGLLPKAMKLARLVYDTALITMVISIAGSITYSIVDWNKEKSIS